MNWHQTLNSVKVFGMCWRRLYRVLDSCIDNTRNHTFIFFLIANFQSILDLYFPTVLEVLKADACRPECTWEFCKANPNEICSAR